MDADTGGPAQMPGPMPGPVPPRADPPATASPAAPPAASPAADAVDLPALYDAHWHHLVRLAVLLVDDVASAEDVVQDAFVALHRRAGELRDPAAAVGYLRTTVLNLSRSVLRRRGVARRHLKVAEPEATAGADQDVLLRDEHRTALAAVRALPRHQREVLVLRYWSGLSEREIARTLGISPGAVKSAASRGMATLARVLGSERPVPERSRPARRAADRSSTDRRSTHRPGEDR